MADEKEWLVPTSEEVEQARAAYAQSYTGRSPDDGNPGIEGRAKIYALCRLYPAVGALLGTLRLDAPAGFGFIDVGLPRDPVYTHVVLDVEDFLTLATRGEIVLNQRGYPDYIGRERLRH